jgi:hypothetical protein
MQRMRHLFPLLTTKLEDLAEQLKALEGADHKICVVEVVLALVAFSGAAEVASKPDLANFREVDERAGETGIRLVQLVSY